MATSLRAAPRLRSALTHPHPSPINVCRGCRRSDARAYSNSSSATRGVAALSSRRLISVAGPDAAKYLQGVITASILRLGPADDHASPTGLYTAFLSAQGRVLHDVFVYRDTLGVAGNAKRLVDDGGAFLIEVDADEAATLTQHIKRYKLRAKFDVRLLEAGELTVWHGWGDDLAAAEKAAAAAIVHRDTRAPGLGWRCVSAAAAPPLDGLAATDELAYRVHRYRLGVAEGQREILRNVALPLESNMDLMGGIDYHKGCYVGQELTIRTKHRGVVRKRILPCIVYEEGGGGGGDFAAAELPPFDASGRAASVPPETSIGRVGKRGRSAGKWLAGVGNVGLALCRLETMTDVTLPDEAAAAAASAAATLDPASEFVLNVKEEGEAEAEGEAVTAGPTLKVKAFVPAWLRQGLAPAAA